MYIDCYKTNTKFLYRYIGASGVNNVEIPYESELFTETKDSTGYIGFKTGVNLKRHKFDSSKKFNEFLEKMGSSIYGNVSEYMQFLSKVKVQSDKVNQIKIWAIDIEVYSEDDFPSVEKADKYPITVISMKSFYDSIKYTWMIDPRNRCSLTSTDIWKIFKFNTEVDMIESFLKFFSDNISNIHVITGWNSLNYDIPYIIRRSVDEFGIIVNCLSPFGIVSDRSRNNNVEYRIAGIQQLDYMQLFKKFSIKPYVSYKLDDVALAELKESKSDHSMYSSFAEFYKMDIDRYISYNGRDVDLIQMLDSKSGYISLAIGIAMQCRINFNDVYSPIKCWEGLIYNELKENNQYFYPRKHMYDEDYVGAWVMEPKKGFVSDIISYDMTSLYPSVIRAVNISPETIDEENEVTDISIESMLDKIDILEDNSLDRVISPSGSLFKRDFQGVIPKLMKRLFIERVEANTLKKKKQRELVELELKNEQ